MMPPFLTPLFLAGLALVAVPWLIHRMRRHERNPIAFSSLIFVPKVDKEVIQRRKLQHLLLMLMRMIALALLALAFARPFLPVAGAPPETPEGIRTHVLLIDRSLSMSASGRMEAARRSAMEALESIPEGEPVALIAFARRPQVLRSVPGEDSLRRDIARSIEGLEPTAEGTDLTSALMAAEACIREIQGGNGGGVIHLVSDLQESGIGPGAPSTWRLPPGMELRIHDLGGPDPANRSVADVAVRMTKEHTFRIAAKLRNWSMPTEPPFAVRLYVDGELQAEQPMEVMRHHASQAVFTYEPGTGGGFDGWIEIADDGIAADNRRYFAWNPPVPPRVLFLETGAGGEDWPTGWFARAALEGVASTGFKVTTRPREDAPALLSGEGERPDVVLCGDLGGAGSAIADAVLDWVQAGGRALMAIGADAEPGLLNHLLLPRLGLVSLGAVRGSGVSSRYALMDWIDYEHPIFRGFDAPRYNDFSSIRIYGYQTIGESAVPDGGTGRVRVLARMERQESGSPGPPALLEIRHGEGRVLLWTFSFDPRSTNFPKSSRFAPVMYESAKYLAGEVETTTEFEIGTVPIPSGRAGGLLVRDAGGAATRLDDVEPGDGNHATDPIIDRAGIVWSGGDGLDEMGRVGVANVPVSESDPVRLTPEAALARFGPLAEPSDAWVRDEDRPGISRARAEFGPAFLAAVFALLLVEVWYASRLVR